MDFDYEDCHPDMQGGPLEDSCWHTIIVSISDTECQCTGCLRVWPKVPDFKPDYPELYGY